MTLPKFTLFFDITLILNPLKFKRKITPKKGYLQNFCQTVIEVGKHSLVCTSMVNNFVISKFSCFPNSFEINIVFELFWY